MFPVPLRYIRRRYTQHRECRCHLNTKMHILCRQHTTSTEHKQTWPRSKFHFHRRPGKCPPPLRCTRLRHTGHIRSLQIWKNDREGTANNLRSSPRLHIPPDCTESLHLNRSDRYFREDMRSAVMNLDRMNPQGMGWWPRTQKDSSHPSQSIRFGVLHCSTILPGTKVRTLHHPLPGSHSHPPSSSPSAR